MKPLAANVVVYNREQVFASRLNQFLHIGLQLPERDYYQGLTFESLVGLKSVLSDINNIFTLKVGLGFAHWLGNRLGLSETERECIVNSIVQNPPNANGYDVEIPDPINVIAEIKCNIPINKGAVFGSAQRNGIEKDVLSLIQGKSKSRMEPSKCLNSLCFLTHRTFGKQLITT